MFRSIDGSIATEESDRYYRQTRREEQQMSLTLICESCGELFAPDEARQIEVLGPEYARYECPDCGYVVRSRAPTPDEKPIPAIVPIEE